MKLKRISLTDKFVILFIALGVFAAGTVSGITYFLAKDAILSRTFDQLTFVKHIKKRQIESFFQERKNDLKVLNSYFDKKHISGELTESNIKYIDDFLFNNGIYTGYQIVFDQGNTYQKDFESEIAQSNLKPTQITDLKNEHSNLVISTSINQENKVIGFLHLQIGLDAINKIMLEKDAGTGLGESGESYLVGNDLLMRSTSRFQKNSIMTVTVDTKGVNDALQGLSDTDVILDYRSIEVLSSYCKLDIPGLDWVLLAEIDYKEAMAPIDEIRNYILFLTVSISLFVFLLAYMISKRISKPLQNLTDAVKRIGAGDLNVKVAADSKDEIGDLTDAFNTMSTQLKQQNDELVEERLQRYTAATDAQEQERERLSRELHDGIGQTLIANKLKFEQLFDKDSSDLSSVNIVDESFDRAIDEIKRISNDLMPSVLMEFGLDTAIKRLCSELSDVSDINITMDYSTDRKIRNKRTLIYLYRIVQEALNNAQKYSKSNSVKIRIFEKEEKLYILIVDDGIGFDMNKLNLSKGAGLYNMNERARIMNGKAEITSEPGRGVSIEIMIPLSQLDEVQ